MTQNICDGHYGQLIPDPDPERCYAYIHCVVSVPNYHECPIGEIFNEVQGRCLLGNRDTCEVDILSETCRDIFFGARPYPGEDSTGRLFIGCILGEGQLLSCYENEVFDSMTNECIVGQISTTLSTETSSTSTSTEEITTSSSTSTPPTPSTSTSTSSSSTSTSTYSSTPSTSTSTSSTSTTSTETTTTSTITSTSTQSTTTTSQEITPSSSTTSSSSSSPIITTTPPVTTTTPFNPCRGFPNGEILFETIIWMNLT